ncbi:GTPase IMAP member 9 [Bulinus truncatus]|nr:GTPase IMAP member 9 [Bulinus truncatus]
MTSNPTTPHKSGTEMSGESCSALDSESSNDTETHSACGGTASAKDLISQMQDQLTHFQQSFHIKEMNSEHVLAVNLGGLSIEPNLKRNAPMVKPLQEIDLFLIGKTGNGKSAVGNSILGRYAFESKPSLASVTSLITYNVAEVRGYRFKVVDGPGVGDTNLDTEEDVSAAIEVVSKAVTISPNGYHAFLLVLKFGQRFTPEEQATVGLLKTIFGEAFFKRFCIIVMTCGDNFKKEIQGTFKDWVLEQKCEKFQQTLRECGNRIVLFDNRTQDSSSAKAARDLLLVETGREIISEKIMTEANLIFLNLQEIVKERNPHLNSQSLQELSVRAAKLCHQITETDKGTGALHALLSHVQTIANTIQTETAMAKKIAEEKDAFKKRMKIEAHKYAKMLQQQKDELGRGFIDERTETRRRSKSFGKN